jgi:hypothetical protein
MYGYQVMNISNAACPECKQPMTVSRMACPNCHVSLEGEFELPPLARLAPEDQAFVIAFIRHHGSIKKMEELFDISYPTVKNRLNALAAALDKTFEAPTPNLYVLEQLARGEITVEEALERLN